MPHWDDYYATRSAPKIPSQFCVFVANEFPDATTVIDAGCGNGRDSEAFANFGYRVFAFDGSPEAVESCRARKIPNAEFFHGDASSEDIWQTLADQTADHAGQLVIYARFFLHAIDEAAEKAMLENLKPLLDRGNAVFCVECRTSRDQGSTKVTPDHYRRFVDSAKFYSRLGKLGLKILYAVEGYGMAKYGDDDAHVFRVICEAE